MTTDETRDQSDICHFAPYGSTNAACDETVPRGALSQDATQGLYSDPRFTDKRSSTTCAECRWRAGILPGEQGDAPVDEQQRAEFVRAREVIDRMFGWKHLRRYGRMSEEWMARLRDGIARAIISGHMVPAADVSTHAPSADREKLMDDSERPTIGLAREIAGWDQDNPGTRRIPHWAVNLAAHLRDKGYALAAPHAPSDQGQVEASNQIAAIVAEQVDRTWPDLHPVLRLRYGIADAVIAAFPDIAARASRTPHIADEAVQKLRGLGLDDTAIRERLAQATMLACAPVSDELVQVIVRIAAKATITSEDLHQMEHRGIRVTLPRGPAPVDEAKLAEVIWEEQESRFQNGYLIHTPDTARSTARAVLEHLDSLRGDGR